MGKKLKKVWLRDNEWCVIAWKGQREECCKCGSEHDVDYRVKGGKLQFRARAIERKKP